MLITNTKLQEISFSQKQSQTFVKQLHQELQATLFQESFQDEKPLHDFSKSQEQRLGEILKEVKRTIPNKIKMLCVDLGNDIYEIITVF